MQRYIVGDAMRVYKPEKPPMRHPDVHRFFGSFDHESGRYTAHNWLRERYPSG
jgi:hypothetical protein